MDKEEQNIGLCKRIDKIENYFNSKEFVEKLVNNISEIVLCDNCGKVVMAHIGGRRWSRKGFFQVGKIKNRIASWCSDECESQSLN